MSLHVSPVDAAAHPEDAVCITASTVEVEGTVCTIALTEMVGVV
jgi:hypothetical protein